MHRKDLVRRLTAALAAVTLTAGAGVALTAPASAVTLGSVTTTFEIDGNKTSDGGTDWDDVLASGSNVVFGYDSGADAAGCSTGIDDTVFAGGAKIDDEPWVVSASPEPSGKGDACTGASAYEIVDVDGADHVILYQYWTRYQGLGDMTTYQVLSGADDSSRYDDVLIQFDYQSAGAQTDVSVLRWNGSAWEPSADTLVYEAAVGANTDTPSTGNDATFGELAIDLTAAGLFPSGECATYSPGGFITRTGNSQNASTEDILSYGGDLVISNCGSLTVEKVGAPAGVTSEDIFAYTVTQSDGQLLHDETLSGTVTDTYDGGAGIGANIGVGDEHAWSPLFAGDDYVLAETIAPELPWAHTSTVCTVTNPATGDVEVTDETFAVYAGATTACVITNTLQEASLTLTKQVEGAPADYPWSFDVTIDPAPADAAATQAVTAAAPTISWAHLSLGTTYTLTEAAAPEWAAGDIVCVGVADEDLQVAGLQFTPTTAAALDCTLVNTATPEGTVIEKTVTSTISLGEGVWQVDYLVTVTNLSAVVGAIYDLTDTPAFGAGIDIEGATATGPDGSLAASWNPESGVTVLADDLSLPAGTVHNYTVSIVASVPDAMFLFADTTCPTGDSPDAGGFLNTALLEVAGETQEAQACSAPTAPPTPEVPVTNPPTPVPPTPLAATGGTAPSGLTAGLLLVVTGIALTAVSVRRRHARR
ncbi:hypothetical protein LG299_12690 [Microbacterium lacus]|uniref:prealbumin-like fold domain-containing protein n=1 Tax=Microbacterium lacus TaxID=415217 RepID=UPI00385007B1